MKLFTIALLFLAAADAAKNDSVRGRQRRAKSDKKSKCAKFDYEIDMIDDFEGSVSIYTYADTESSYWRNLDYRYFDTDIETEVDKIKSCGDKDGHCVNSTGVTELRIEICAYNDNSYSFFDQTVEKVKLELGDAKFEWPKGDDELGTVNCGCCFFDWDASDPDVITPTCDNCHCRRTEELEIPSPEQLDHLVHHTMADLDSVLEKKDHVISEESCYKAREFLATAWSEGMVTEKDANHHGKPVSPDHFEVSLTGEQLVEMIGMEDTKALYDFFVDSMGYRVPVTQIHIQHSDTKDVVSSTPLHAHREPELIVFLRDESVTGGGMAHVDLEGGRHLEMIDNGASAGSAYVQGPMVLHGTHSWTGAREVIILISDVGAKPKECLLKDLF